MILRMFLRRIGTLIALLCAAAPAFACKCAVVSRNQVIASTPVVFEGRVVSVETQGTVQLTTLAVVRSIKGRSRGTRVKVESQTVSAACGHDFRAARKTLLVGGEAAASGVLAVRRCTMSNLNR
jgi:hypothetical protein